MAILFGVVISMWRSVAVWSNLSDVRLHVTRVDVVATRESRSRACSCVPQHNPLISAPLPLQPSHAQNPQPPNPSQLSLTTKTTPLLKYGEQSSPPPLSSTSLVANASDIKVRLFSSIPKRSREKSPFPRERQRPGLERVFWFSPRPVLCKNINIKQRMTLKTRDTRI